MTCKKSKGVKLVHNTLQSAIDAVDASGIKWEYCHQPDLSRTGYMRYAGPNYGDSEPGLFYYFVNSGGDEVAMWCIPLGTVQFLETPRKVDRDHFPDGEKVYRKRKHAD